MSDIVDIEVTGKSKALASTAGDGLCTKPERCSECGTAKDSDQESEGQRHGDGQALLSSLNEMRFRLICSMRFDDNFDAEGIPEEGSPPPSSPLGFFVRGDVQHFPTHFRRR